MQQKKQIASSTGGCEFFAIVQCGSIRWLPAEEDDCGRLGSSDWSGYRMGCTFAILNKSCYRGTTMRRLAFLTFALLALVSSSAFAAEPNTLTDAEKAAGWKLLFDGKSTAGWRNYKKTDIAAGWKAESGALVRGTERAGDIVTTDQYAAFELSLEYNIAPGGNSGLMFHVTEDVDGPPWHTGPEIQIQDIGSGGRDPQKPGWLYQLYKSDVDAAKPAGQWNELRILITPQKCATWMNGQLYHEYVKGSPDWDERVAKSKFAKLPKFGKPTSGHICLQDHGNPVSFRNIKIRVIDQK